jgi:hypothetical protein
MMTGGRTPHVTPMSQLRNRKDSKVDRHGLPIALLTCRQVGE